MNDRLNVRGAMLLEWLIAGALGMLIIAGGLRIYVQVNRFQYQLQHIDELQLRAQSTLQLLVRAFQKAGYWGNQTAFSTTSLDRSSNCQLPNYPQNTDARTDIGLYSVRKTASISLPCLESPTHPLLNNSDVIEIIGLEDSVQHYSSLPEANDGPVYQPANVVSPLLNSERRYHHQWFFLVQGDDGPALQMFYRNKNGIAGQTTGVLVSGIVALRIRAAVCMPDGIHWLASDQMGASDWSQVLAVDIGLLVRSSEPVPSIHSMSEYEIAGQHIHLSGAAQNYQYTTAEQIVWLSAFAMQVQCPRPLRGASS
ncbi:PilW family protein [Celerinatantimonas sp. YJH-8]|uniref:PilW family protein n=1 Tax=Celerinatantimonas sp. YJH-8 TaxID=3228714 RepID=UPI0038C5D8C5